MGSFQTSSCSFLADGKFVGVGSHDNMLDIYNVKRGKKCATCTGNSSYLTHFDWDKRGKFDAFSKQILLHSQPASAKEQDLFRTFKP